MWRGRSEPVLRPAHSKLPGIADRSTSWLDASGWHHLSFPTPYARDVRTRYKVPQPCYVDVQPLRTEPANIC